MKKSITLLLVLMLVVSVAGCGNGGNGELEGREPVELITIHPPTMEFSAARYEAALILQDRWEQLGFEVEVQPMEFSSLMDMARHAPGEKDWGAVIGGWGGRVERLDPDMFLYSLFHSSQAVAGGNNMAGFQNDEYDSLAEQQRVLMDQDERQAVAYDAQQVLADEVPMYVLWYVDGTQALNIERWDEDSVIVTAEGMYNEWVPFYAEPLTDDANFRVGGVQDLDSLNPLVASSTFEWKLLRLVYDKLVRIGPDLEPKPWAAESFEVNEAGDVVDVVLREGMEFHDGEPVTAEDIKFTFDFMVEKNVPYFAGFLDPIDTVELLEDDTIRFNLEQPYAPFITNTLGQIPIIPKHIWEDIEEVEGLDHPDEYENIPAIGSGPFEYGNWERGQFVELEKFENYFEADRIALDKFTYDIFSHEEGQFGALENQTIDMVAEGFESDFISRVEELDHLQFSTHPSIGLNYIALNTTEAPFDDVEVRRAVGHTIDYEEFVDVLYEGYATPGGPGRVISPANDFWRNPDVTEYEYDIELARQRLEDAGYDWDDEGRIYYPEN